jgi:Ca-activated chloride channel family protein
MVGYMKITVQWGYPYGFIFLLVCGVLLGLVGWRFNVVSKMLRRLVPADRLGLLLHYHPWRMKAKLLLWVLALIALFLTLAHPQRGTHEETVAQQGRDLFIALDISRSMLAHDVKPNRLGYAKEKIKTLLSLLSCERVSLLLFSSSAVVQCPLTTDYGAFFMALDAVDSSAVGGGTTALDQVIAKVLALLATTPAKKSKLLIVLTDGEDFSSTLASIKQQAQQQELHIVTLGIGTTQGAPIPVLDAYGNQQDFEKDEQGKVVISRLNEGILQTLAADTGGIAVMATPTTDDLKKIVSYVTTFEKEQLDDKKIIRLQEQYPYFLVISFIGLLLEWLL